MLRLMAVGVLVGVLELVSMALVIPAIALISGASTLANMPLPDWVHARFASLPWHQSLFAVIGLLFVSYTAKAAVQVFYYRSYTALTARWQRDLAIRLLRGQLGAPYDVYLQRHSATLIRDIAILVHETYGRFLNALFSLVADSSSALALILLSVFVAPLPTLVAGTMLILIYSAQHFVFQKIHRRLGEQSIELLKREQLCLHQSLGAFREMRIARRESDFMAQFERVQRELCENAAQFEFTRRLPPVLGELTIILCVTIAVLVLMSASPEPGRITVGLGLLAAVAFRLSPLANRLVGSTGTMQNARAGLEVLAAHVAEDRAAARPPSACESRVAFASEIDLKGVSYCYPGRDRFALRKVDLAVRKGQVIGVVGASGAGKTTLIDVILGLLVPTEGVVQVDGKPLGGDRYLKAAYVPQEIFLFDDTLRANIAFGAAIDDLDDKEIHRVLRLVRLEDLVGQLPRGLDTKLGEQGRLLSGGQRQRVGIARALSNHPELLVLDEATSAMDVHTEERITDAIAALRGKLTIIVIAHRLSTVRNCDSIVVLNEGCVVGQGNFDELYVSNAAFRAMVVSASLASGAPLAPDGD